MRGWRSDGGRARSWSVFRCRPPFESASAPSSACASSSGVTGSDVFGVDVAIDTVGDVASVCVTAIDTVVALNGDLIDDAIGDAAVTGVDEIGVVNGVIDVVGTVDAMCIPVSGEPLARLLARSKRDKAALFSSSRKDMPSDAAAEAMQEESLIRKVFTSVLTYCVCQKKGGWKDVERTISFVHMISEREILQGFFVMHDLLADLLESVLQECPNQVSLMTQPCRDNTLYILALVDELVMKDTVRYLPAVGDTRPEDKDSISLSGGGYGLASLLKPGSRRFSLGDQIASTAQELPPPICSRRMSGIRESARGWHKETVGASSHSISRDKCWRLYNQVWVLLEMMNGRARGAAFAASDSVVLMGGSSGVASGSGLAGLVPPPTIGQRARCLVESINAPAAEVAAAVSGSFGAVVGGGISGITSKGSDKAMKMRGEKCPRVVFRLVLLYLHEADLESAAKCKNQFLSLLPDLLSVENEANKNRLQLFLRALHHAKSLVGFMDDGARGNLILQLIQKTSEHFRSMVATTVDKERRGKDDLEDEEDSMQSLQHDKVAAALNSQTVKNARPLPRIDDGSAKYFSKLDLKSGYHQISIRPNNRYKSAFKTPYGHFEWVVMPCGLTKALTTFQVAMTNEFRAMLDRSVLVYLDDILVYSRSLEDHLEHLRRVLETLRRAKYKADRDKCEFVRQELEYLGHFVTPEGIIPLSNKIQAIQEWPDPRNVTDVRSFLGLAGYYQCFIKGYSKIAAHLTKLQCENRPFDFGEEAREAFLALKVALLSAEVLRIYDPLLPTRVTTDASGYGIGVVLEQRDGVDWHPVEYFNKKVAAVHSIDDTRKKELLAFVHALKRWWHFLLGRSQFRWVTDNNPLVFYKTQNTINSTIARWMAFSDQFDLFPDHIPGKSNRFVDALSRRPDHCTAVYSTFEIDDDLRDGFIRGYQADPKFHDKYGNCSSPNPSPSHYRIQEGYLLVHTRGKDLLCVPSNPHLRTRLLGEFHDAPAIGHFGVNHTIGRLRERFWWPGLLGDVTRYCESCEVCRRCNPATIVHTARCDHYRSPCGKGKRLPWTLPARSPSTRQEWMGFSRWSNDSPSSPCFCLAVIMPRHQSWPRRMEAASQVANELEEVKKQREQMATQVDLLGKMEIMARNIERLAQVQEEQYLFGRGQDIALRSIRLRLRDFARELATQVGSEVRPRLEGTKRYCTDAIEGARLTTPKEEEARPRREPVKVKFPDSYSGKREENFDNWEANVKTYVHLQKVSPDGHVPIAIHALRDEAASFARFLCRAANCNDDLVAYSAFTPLTDFLKLLRERFADVSHSVKASDRLQTIHSRQWKSARALVAIPDHGVTETQLVNLFYWAMLEQLRGHFFEKSQQPTMTYDALTREVVAFKARSMVSLGTSLTGVADELKERMLAWAKMKKESRGQLVLVDVEIFRGRVGALVDSGATRSYIGRKAVQKLKLGRKVQKLPEPIVSILADNRTMRVEDYVEGVQAFFHLEKDGKVEKVLHSLTLLVEDHLSFDIVLGMDWGEAAGATLHLREHECRRPSPSGGVKTARLFHVSGVDDSLAHCCLSAPTFARLVKEEQLEEQVFVAYARPVTEPKEEKPIDPAMAKLLEEFTDLAKPPTGVVPRPIQHRIEIEPGSRTPKGAVYRMSPRELEELRKQLDEFLEKGWIRPSSSPFGAPVLFVPKKEGELKMCIEYRALNAITVKNAEPPPRIDDLLDRVQGCKYFSEIDLKSGYHQVEVHPDDQYKTAFRTRYGHYEFIVMPFGLTNAPTTFQRFMNDLFRSWLDRFVVVYLDDILVFSRTLQEHEGRLRQVLEKLREANFKISAKKCEWAKTQVLYLGHVLDGDDIKPEDSKIAAINWPTPRTLTELRSFEGLANYYRKFVRNFSTIAAPLRRLLKKKTIWKWDKDCMFAMKKLKQGLIEYAVLKQDDGNGYRPVEFMFARMPSEKVATCTYKRELYALRQALEHWKHYLLGRHFKVYPDHETLRWLKTQAKMTPKLTRWAAELDQYDFELKPLKVRVVVDALSRRADYFGAIVHYLDIGRDLQQKVRVAYVQDPIYSDLLKRVKEAPRCRFGLAAPRPDLGTGYTGGRPETRSGAFWHQTVGADVVSALQVPRRRLGLGAQLKDEMKYISQAQKQRMNDVEALKAELDEASAAESQQLRAMEEQRQTVLATIVNAETARRSALQLAIDEEQQAIVRHWCHMFRGLTDERGPWAPGPSPGDPPLRWKLDKTEDPWRRRMRLKRNYHFDENLVAPTNPLPPLKKPHSEGDQDEGAGEKESSEPAGGGIRHVLLTGLMGVKQKGVVEVSGTDDPSGKGDFGEAEVDNAALVAGAGAAVMAAANDELEKRQQSGSGAETSGSSLEDDKVFVSLLSVLITPKRKVAGRLELMRKHLIFHGEMTVEGSAGSSVFEMMTSGEGPYEGTAGLGQKKADRKVRDSYDGNDKPRSPEQRWEGFLKGGLPRGGSATVSSSMSMALNMMDAPKDVVKRHRRWAFSQVRMSL
ncbi:hypothetical protein CBR_g9087 [Chara braunii]|uniref:RNA-directed DNA polymerase n=1 Tax=Chara braunii TaxID=69332 RepID=A0A388KP07_CHABU|nr:hypothetical protein CBR_g9087 [Chara braunii]|eukprot:GBG71673.1 hypothetical protein CBR_g9087 [Chara braunii]